MELQCMKKVINIKFFIIFSKKVGCILLSNGVTRVYLLKKTKIIHKTEHYIILWQISKKKKIDLFLLKQLPVYLHTIHVHYTDSWKPKWTFISTGKSHLRNLKQNKPCGQVQKITSLLFSRLGTFVNFTEQCIDQMRILDNNRYFLKHFFKANVCSLYSLRSEVSISVEVHHCWCQTVSL